MEILESRSVLYERLEGLIEKNIANKEMIQNIQRKFMEKNMSLNAIVLLANGTLAPKELSFEELIAVTQAMYSTLKEESIKPDRFFKPEELAQFEGYVYIEEDKYYMNTIKLNEFREIKYNKVYSGYLTLKELYMIYKNRLYFYNYDTQRASDLKKIGTKDSEENIVRTKSVNEKSVEAVKDLFLKEDYVPDEISFNIRLLKGQKAQYSIKKYKDMKTIVDLTIQPEYDLSTNRATYLDLTDGFHRFLSAALAYRQHLEETGKELQGGLTVVITMMNVQDAARFVARKFIRNETNKEFVNAMSGTESIKLAKQIVDRFKCTKELKVVNTWDELRVYNAFATINDIDRVILECSKLDMDDVSAVDYYENEVSEIVDSLVIKLMNRFDSIEVFKKTDLRGKMIAGYIAIADRLRKEDKPRVYINDIVEYLYGLNETGEINKMKMVTANANLNTIYNYFYEMADETVKNA